MTEPHDTLQQAFKAYGYEVANITQNRNLIRVTLYDETARANELEAIVEEALNEQPLGLDVATETISSEDTVGTVVSFRQR